MLLPSFLINRSHSAKPSELASAPAYSRFSPPTGVPPLYDLFQFHVLRFYGKVRGPHGEGCTFVHISARFRRFVYVPELLRAVRSSKRQDSRRPRHPMPSSSIPFPGYLFHLSGYSITLSKQDGYILNFQSFIFQPCQGQAEPSAAFRLAHIRKSFG